MTTTMDSTLSLTRRMSRSSMMIIYIRETALGRSMQLCDAAGRVERAIEALTVLSATTKALLLNHVSASMRCRAVCA